VDGNGTEKIWYNDTANDDVDFAYEEMTAYFMWDSVDSHWLVSVSQTPLSGTWSGSLDMTGTLKVDTIQPHTTSGSVTIDGYAAFGSGNTGLKCKLITGTTAGAEGGGTSVAHGLTLSKIVSYSGCIQVSSTLSVVIGGTASVFPEYASYIGLDNTNITVNNDATSSGNILSKTFYITVWYIA
jgi:hypothetical protein